MGGDMKTPVTACLSLLVGAAIGAGATQTLHAQAKPPAYVVIEADVKNQIGFAKEYIPLARKALSGGSYGYKVLARNGKTVTLDGAPPKKRVIINQFTDLDHAVAAYNSPEYNAARAVGRQYADIRMFAIEGLSQ
jgi:uncharacterized protein (DUF1330 family)